MVYQSRKVGRPYLNSYKSTIQWKSWRQKAQDWPNWCTLGQAYVQKWTRIS